MTTVAVIGLGYVGLPLVVEFGKRIRTIGFDIAEAKVAACQRGTDPSRELVFQSFGITADQRSVIAAEVVAGSGLPYVLPNSDWVYLGSGDASQVAAASQAAEQARFPG